MARYSQTKQLWSQWYQKGNYTQSTNQPDNIETSQQLTNIYGPKMDGCRIFCEFGTGSGRNIHYFHQRYPDWRYIGNDINPDIHNQIKSIYPDLLEYASIEIIDTLSYLQRADFCTDIAFTHGHLMHLPGDVIKEVCSLIAEKTRRYILLHEAYINGRGISLAKRLKYRKYRFDRDYKGMFAGFLLEEKHIIEHAVKKGIRHCTYFFKKTEVIQ